MAESTPNPAVEESPRPLIVLLSLHKDVVWDKIYWDVVKQLKLRATVKELTNLRETGEFLSTHKASAIIATDQGVVRKANLCKKVVEYVRNGGTLILGTFFPNSIHLDELGRWFREAWDLPWESYQYHRSLTTPNASRMASRLTDERLPGPYSQKALGLKNVPVEARVYNDPRESQNCPVVFTTYGKGWLGYMGDVNGEKESTQVLLAMCDLL